MENGMEIMVNIFMGVDFTLFAALCPHKKADNASEAFSAYGAACI